MKDKNIKEFTTPEEFSTSIEEFKPNLATKIALELENNVELFTDGKEKAYAKFDVGGHNEIWPVRSKKFSRWITRFARSVNDGNIPSSESIKTAIHYLEGIAFEGPEIELFNRVGKKGEEYWYDLVNENWQAIKITKNGWKIIENPPIIFKREIHQKSQVKPTRNGKPWKLFDYIKIPDEKQLLLMVYIMSCFIPDIPHPVLNVFGSPGAGKSMTTEFIGEIIDPTRTPHLKIPKTDKDIIQNFDHHYAVFFDNLAPIKGEISDMLCRAVTGESTEYRALYTDDEAIIRNYRRCIILNGVNISAERSDLLDRSILIPLKRIEEGVRLDEKSLRLNFKEELPSILGGIMDCIVEAINIYPTVELKSLPRMADFAKWGYALSEALGQSGERFMQLYSLDNDERIDETIEYNPLAIAIILLVDQYQTWQGSPTELLNELNFIAYENDIDTKNPYWPKDSVWVTRRINNIQNVLEYKNISYEHIRKAKGKHIILQKIKYTENSDILDIKDSDTVHEGEMCVETSEKASNDSNDSKIDNTIRHQSNETSPKKLWTLSKSGDLRSNEKLSAHLKNLKERR